MAAAASSAGTVPGSHPKATVVVVNWNGAHLIGPCLESLSQQTLDRSQWQVWVVDNNSSDDSVSIIEREHPWVRLIRNPDNRGFAGGNNTALRQLDTEYAVLLNNDATPEPDWLENLLAPLEAEGSTLAVTASKILFMPRFVRLRISTPGFSPGAHDTRDLGVRIHSVKVDGHEVADHVLWEKLTYGPEGDANNCYRWTRPAGELLIPLPVSDPTLKSAQTIEFAWAGEKDKWVKVEWDGGETTLPVTAEGGSVSMQLPRRTPTVDVINNVGGVVFDQGYGADRGFQQVDAGQFDKAEPVFTACGNGAAIRTAVGNELDWFDDDFFLYYEDTDLFWRIRSRGYEIGYEPSAVLRHIHSASSGEASPVFRFHVARNRLLMLVKDATASLALQQVFRFLLTTASITVRALRVGLKERRRPPLRDSLMNLKVLRSFLRLLPKMLLKRRRVRRGAKVGRAALQEKWLVPHS